MSISHDWDARAKALGGNGHSLVAGFAAKLGDRMGRRRAPDGAVTLLIPTSDRDRGRFASERAETANISVDPTHITRWSAHRSLIAACD